jgi:hypothetical protein
MTRNLFFLHKEYLYTYIWFFRKLYISNSQYLICEQIWPHFQTAISVVFKLNVLQANGREATEGTDVTSLPDMTNSNTLAIFLSTMVNHLTVS